MSVGNYSKAGFGLVNGLALMLSITASRGAIATNQIIASGQRHTLVLRADGTVWSLGGSYSGQGGFGYDIGPFVTFPMRVQGIVGAVSVAAGDEHSLVLRGDGTVSAFGDNSQGQLGINSTAEQNTPTNINTLASVRTI